MRELDVLLSSFLDSRYGDLPATEKRAFETLLELPDPELHGYLLGRDHVEHPAQASVVRKLREFRR